MVWISGSEMSELSESKSSSVVEYPITTRAWREYSSSSENSDSTLEKGESYARIWACSRSFAAFSFFGQFLAKWPGFQHMKQTFKVFPLNCLLLRNFHFIFLKILFFGSAWYFFLKGYFLKWLLFFTE